MTCLSSEDCNKFYLGIVQPTMFCAGDPEGGVDACQVVTLNSDNAFMYFIPRCILLSYKKSVLSSSSCDVFVPAG